MKKTIDTYISELLFLYDCVIIPEFGGFVGNNKSAILNKKSLLSFWVKFDHLIKEDLPHLIASSRSLLLEFGHSAKILPVDGLKISIYLLL